ncbi:MAG: LacI family transcriptional regulator [Abditibacteriales bacterium]|nr:LacI family transcriptional regulator [Abditibacteriales bacterium]MDW8364752.1 LacI family DNA-binding transcriptional regulator [Abditibacteriales bacterium]
MAATIRDVAKLAGTSVSAASAVLNGSGRGVIRVGPETRRRIEAAAEQLGYMPNPIAQSLVTRRTGVLGLIFPYSSAFIDRNPFCTQVMAGVFEEVVHAKYNLMLYTAIGDEWNAADENALIDPRVDGLILVIPAPHSPVIARCMRERRPYVALVYEPDAEEVYAVNADEFTGGRLATEHLIRLGHRRIAHLRGDPGVASTAPRERGYIAALEAAGMPPAAALIVPAGFDWKEGYEAMKRLLELPSSQRPTAVFAANDLCAEGALRALRERGLRVPEDMAVVGYDDTWFATMTQPPLTSVHMPLYEMSQRATQMLIAQVEGNDVAVRQPVLPVSLTVRESCGAQSARGGNG